MSPFEFVAFFYPKIYYYNRDHGKHYLISQRRLQEERQQDAEREISDEGRRQER